MHRPRLILLCGLPGAGKTTLARRLERQLDAVRLCPDEWPSSDELSRYDPPIDAEPRPDASAAGDVPTDAAARSGRGGKECRGG